MANGHGLDLVDGMTPAIEAADLYRFYHAGDEETLALRGVSLTVDPGEVVAVVGPSGSGKSTLLACLAGLDEPDGGAVTVLGERLSRRTERVRAAIRSRHIGMLFQQANLLEALDVRENVEVARRLGSRGVRRDARPVDALLTELGIERRAQARPSTLSGGELARAGLAVALANDPAVVLADEPTGELDRTNATAMTSLLRARARAGTAVIVVTHNAEVAAAADRVLTMRDGSVQ